MATTNDNPIVFFDMTLGGKRTDGLLHMIPQLLPLSNLHNHRGAPWPHKDGIVQECDTKGSATCFTARKSNLTIRKTAENFRQFCTGETKNAQARPQGYKGCRVHRVVSEHVCVHGTCSN